MAGDRFLASACPSTGYCLFSRQSYGLVSAWTSLKELVLELSELDLDGCCTGTLGTMLLARIEEVRSRVHDSHLHHALQHFEHEPGSITLISELVRACGGMSNEKSALADPSNRARGL